MKRLVVLAVVVFVLALMVSSASAHVILTPPTYPEMAASSGVRAQNAVIAPSEASAFMHILSDEVEDPPKVPN